MAAEVCINYYGLFLLQDGNAGLIGRLVARVSKHNVQTLTHVSDRVNLVSYV